MATGIGIVSGFALLLTAVFMGGGTGVFLNLEAVMITVGGTIAATLIGYPLDPLSKFFKLVVQLLKEEHQSVFEQTISRLVMLEQKASRDTVFSLKKEAKKESNRYLKAGLQLLVQDAPGSGIARRFAIEQEGVKSRHALFLRPACAKRSRNIPMPENRHCRRS
jgi:chemotaxis protein MotA